MYFESKTCRRNLLLALHDRVFLRPNITWSFFYSFLIFQPPIQRLETFVSDTTSIGDIKYAVVEESYKYHFGNTFYLNL